MLRNAYIGKSGQLWLEVSRDDTTIQLRPDYYSKGFPRSLLFPIDQLATVCGMRLIGTHTDFQTIQLTPPQGESNAQKEPQGAQSPLRWDDRPIHLSSEAIQREATIQAAIFPPPGFQFPTHQPCKECGGSGLDHPCSAKSRNTDDDTCPRCKGTKVEPPAKPTDEGRPANLSDIDYGH